MKNKSYLLMLCMLIISLGVKSQTQIHPITGAIIPNPYETTIQEIQSISGSRLANCDDKSSFHTFTVIVRGRMNISGKTTFEPMTVGGVVYPGITTTTGTNAFGRELSMQAGTGPYAGIWIRPTACNTALTPHDLLDAVAGDSVCVMGIVDDSNGNGYGGETQLIPLNFTLLGINAPNIPPAINGQSIEGIAPVTVTVAELNTGTDIVNNLVDGEKYEGMFVEIRDLTVVDYSNGSTSQSTVDFTQNKRYRIVCQDAYGNRIQIYDRFKAGRLPNDATNASSPCTGVTNAGGRLSKVPIIGGKYDYVRGIIVHIKDQVPNLTCGNVATITSPAGPAFDKGYQLEPFYPTHYSIADYNPPIISDLTVSPQAPKLTENVTISATIQSIDAGISIAGATLYYSSDTLNYSTWNSVPMTGSGLTWSGIIPYLGFTEGETVYYYITATDSRTPASESAFPRVPITVGGIIGKDKPAAFVVRNDGLQITDIQKTPFFNGNSLYNGQTVTVTGVATSTVNDLGVVTLQQENVTEWGAIFIDNSPNFNNVKKGDKITVSGTVQEQYAGSFNSTRANFTMLVNPVIIASIASGIKILPLDIDHTLLSGNYDFKKHEKYEAIYARITAPVGKLFVADTNADYPANFSEYRIGTDTTTLLQLPSNITSSIRNTTITGTRILAGRAPVYATNATSQYVISSQAFPLVTNPLQLLSTTSANFPPDTATMRVKYVNAIYASRKVSFDNISGIIQNSFGNMKLLPRDVYDISGLKVDGIAAILTLPGFGLQTTTGINQESLSSNITIFPNPTEGELHIKNSSNSPFSISLFDVVGSSVLKQEIFTQEGVIHLNSLSKGVYIIKVTNLSDNSFSFKRIILQ